MSADNINEMKKVIYEQLVAWRKQGCKRIEIIKAARRAATDFESKEEYL